jgi:serine/threonine protein kinase/Flp pilus assembly protein TadD
VTVRCPKCHFDNPSDSVFCSKCGTRISEGTQDAHSQNSRDVRSGITETLQTPIQELGTGSTLAGRYQIIEELGHGGMGRVYKVFDTDIHEKIALKLLRPEIAPNQETVERFSNELKLARKISHRNVCRMFDLGKADGTTFITMEFVPGEDLKRLIRKSGQLGSGRAVSIAKQVSEGLAEAHHLGIVHRDLKPHNIMVDEDGNVRIMDFGIARSLQVKGMTGAGVMIGTPEYMSPEQVEGKEADQRSDIYSLGIVLYEMLTGRVPFGGDTPFTIGVKHKSEPPRDPRELNAQIPAGLSRLVLKCLEKDKARRYQSAVDLYADLMKIEQGLPAAEVVIPKRRPLTSREITVKFPLKKLLIPALGLAAVAVIALALWRFLPRHQAAPPSGKPVLAILYFDNVSGDKDLDAWKTGLTELLITKLSQSKLINVLDGTTIYSILKKFNLDDAKKYTKGDLEKVADEGGATHTLSGSLMKAGPNIIVTLSLQKPRTGEVISSIPVECRGEQEIMSKMDEVATRIKSDLDISPQQIAGDTDKEIDKITTASPEAYKYYSEARRFHLAQNYKPAIPLYEKAVAIDPAFAMAYRGLAALYSNGGDVVRMRANIKKAMELSDRVSERERLVIQGQYYYEFSEKTIGRAIKTFQKLLELYPDDHFANLFLGEIYHQLEEPEKALPYHLASLKGAKEVIYIWNVYHDYQHLGQYDAARKVLEDNLPAVADDPGLPAYLGWNYLYQGKYDLALSEADKAFLRSPNSSGINYLKACVYLLQDDMTAAEKEFRALGGGPDLNMVQKTQGRYEAAKAELKALASLKPGNANAARANLELQLAYLDLRTEDLKPALTEIEDAMKIYVELDMAGDLRTALTVKGIILAEQGDLDRARQTAEELKRSVENGLNRKAIRHYDLVMGYINLKKGDVREAVANFQKAKSLLAFQSERNSEHAFFLEPLAIAYEQAGDIEKASAENDEITRLTSGRLMFGDIYAKAYYRLGRIAEKQGQTAAAAGHYRKFLTLWKDADPGLPEVADAKARLSKLQ